MPERVRSEAVLDAGAILGEGPIWDRDAGCLLWVDILEHRVHVLDPTTAKDDAVDVGSLVGAVAPRRKGGWALAVEDGFAVTGTGGTGPTPVAPVAAGEPNVRFNDGKVDPAGRFFAGTTTFDEAPGAGKLYRLDPDLRTHIALEGVTISNGLGWSPDRRTMYYIDTPTRRVDAFDYDVDTGAMSNRRPFVDVHAGSPDGMTVDAEGGVWVALWDAWTVQRYLPDGRPDRAIELPAQKVTSCAFGGAALDVLFITSARVGLDVGALAAQPHAGAVFAVEPGITGLEPGRFAG